MVRVGLNNPTPDPSHVLQDALSIAADTKVAYMALFFNYGKKHHFAFRVLYGCLQFLCRAM